MNVDQYAGVRPDVVAHSSSLPFEDRSVTAVYCGHLLEHLELGDELQATLREVRRVLAHGCRLCVVGPDYDRAFANPEWHDVVPGIIRGGNRWPGDAHRWLSTGPRTVKAVRPLFPAATEVPIGSLLGWPVVDTVGWQFALFAEAP